MNELTLLHDCNETNSTIGLLVMKGRFWHFEWEILSCNRGQKILLCMYCALFSKRFIWGWKNNVLMVVDVNNIDKVVNASCFVLMNSLLSIVGLSFMNGISMKC